MKLADSGQWLQVMSLFQTVSVRIRYEKEFRLRKTSNLCVEGLVGDLEFLYYYILIMGEIASSVQQNREGYDEVLQFFNIFNSFERHRTCSH